MIPPPAATGPRPVEPEMACLDLAGTTVADEGLVEQAFEAALAALGPSTDADRDHRRQVVRDTMGMPKIEVFRALAGDEARARVANATFEDSYDRLVAAGAARPVLGAAEAVADLRRAGLRVVLTTGFSVRTRDRLLAHLGWADLADLVLSPSDAGRGRPHPDMILTAVLRLGVSDVRAVVVAGDTAADMRSGRRAGASWVVGVETGADAPGRLWAAGATHVVESVAALPALLAPAWRRP